MEPHYFKTSWITNPDIDEWIAINPLELEKIRSCNATKRFLQNGFPKDAAPFLSFDALKNEGFREVGEVYHGEQSIEESKKMLILGSDGNGNPICIDLNNNCSIVILDHELGFEVCDTLNDNLIEFSRCLLEMKKFIVLVRKKYGGNGYMGSLFNIEDVNSFKHNLEKIDKDILTKSSFWKMELEGLIEEANSDVGN